jgi:hypothetical protein
MNWFVLLCSVFLLPVQQLLAANPQPNRPTTPAVRDVALQAGGVLQGQVLDSQGQPVANATVRAVGLGTRAEQVRMAQADAAGRFQIAGLSGGVYRVETAQGVMICRLWAPNTSPPAAESSVLLVHGGETVRGNLGSIGWLGWTLIGLGVAAAIAIPLALNDDDDAS